jgi:hypothetical protein
MEFATLLTAWGGAITGAALGVLGGAWGTYASLRNTLTPAERKFMIRCAVAVWMFVVLFIAAHFLASSPYNLLLWIPYTVILILGIQWMNRVQARLRSEDKP